MFLCPKHFFQSRRGMTCDVTMCRRTIQFCLKFKGKFTLRMERERDNLLPNLFHLNLHNLDTVDPSLVQIQFIVVEKKIKKKINTSRSERWRGEQKEAKEKIRCTFTRHPFELIEANFATLLKTFLLSFLTRTLSEKKLKETQSRKRRRKSHVCSFFSFNLNL